MYLKFKDHLEFLKQAVEGQRIPESLVKFIPRKINPGLNTPETAYFIAELIENFEALLEQTTKEGVMEEK